MTCLFCVICRWLWIEIYTQKKAMEKRLKPYDMEFMRMAILKHEETFKEQVLLQSNLSITAP